HYKKMIVVKHSGRNITLVLKLVERCDQAAEIPLKGEYILKRTSRRKSCVPTLQGESSIDDSASDYSDEKPVLDVVRYRLRDQARRRLNAATATLTFPLRPMTEQIWKEHNELVTKMKRVFEMREVDLRRMGPEIIRLRMLNQIADVLDDRDDAGGGRPGKPKKANGQMRVSSVEPPSNEHISVSSSVLSPSYERRMKKIQDRVKHRKVRVRKALLELRSRLAPEYVRLLLVNDRVLTK
ncbi:hypothetical protein HK101_005972, partial [Irineochytrium annulatum]